jgi:hypothetical protein
MEKRVREGRKVSAEKKSEGERATHEEDKSEAAHHDQLINRPSPSGVHDGETGDDWAQDRSADC